MSIYNRYQYLILAILVLIFGKLTEWNALFPRFDNNYAQKFQKVFDNKERELQNYLLYIEKVLKNTQNSAELQNKLSRFYGLMDKEGFGIFIYRNDSLVYWSDNSVVLGNRYSFSEENTYLNLRNAWFVTKFKPVKNWKIVGLIQIKQVYHYENRYLVNEFQRDFNFPSTVKISSRQVPDGYPIFNSDGMYIFSLVFDKTCQHLWFQLYIPVFSYFLFIILIGFFFCKLISRIQIRRLKRNLIIAVSLLAIILKLITGYYHFPSIFYELDLFDPQYMAISSLIPSMGDLLLWALVFFFISYLIFKNLEILFIRVRKRQHRHLMVAAISLFIIGVFFLMNILVRDMILNSSISFEAHKVLLLNSYSFLGYLILILIFVSFSFLTDRLIGISSVLINYKDFVIIFSASLTLVYLVLRLSASQPEPISYILLAALIFLMGYYRIRQRVSYQFSGLVLVVLIFALYTVDRVVELTLQKNRNETLILASNLANQHDQVGEFLLEEASYKISKDSIITEYLFSSNPEAVSLTNYITNSYFDGYLEKYNLQIIYCYQYDSLYLLPPDNYTVHCRSYFAEKVNTAGVKLPSSSFYFIDNQNGRVSYLGWFEYPHPNLKDTALLFVELDSKVLTDDLGYPELLLDKKVSQKSKFRDYSYAKYFNGALVSKFGYYPYDLSSKDFITPDSTRQFFTKKLNSFNHLIHNMNKNDIIVISYPKVGFFEILIAFSWVFLFYLVVITFVSVFTNLPLLQKAFKPDFKNKIQFSIMSVLFSSLILIGGGTIIFSIKQYNKRHYETLEEKMKSIYIEVVQRIGNETGINQNWSSYTYESLNDLLAKYSNVFYADINLFDTKGNLVATSRPEIFEKGLIGMKINPVAYYELAYNKRSQFLHNERIGRLSYLSGYIPVMNHDNHLIGYMNIPYFTRQEELMHEVSNLVVGIVNVYVILLLISILISILISRRITFPLRMIQEKFSEIKLAQNYTTIEYAGNDEIGGLVKEYNRMVRELEKSIRMLAKSERESAWREMARQIAHEINNPLTPMKLSVQHLLRARKDKSEKFDEYLERISKTLIEEIDNLSSIATEFSNFAKMPKAHNLRFNLVEKINTVVSLFANSEIDFNLHFNNYSSIEVFADKEQISRVFINLFKNAMQAVEKGTRPVIDISLSVEKDRATVKVSDNGPGIPEELREKLFRPNFTTKSSGMGLGLAIIKNIMEDIGGSIRFITETGKGTTFILEFPYLSKEKNVLPVK